MQSNNVVRKLVIKRPRRLFGLLISMSFVLVLSGCQIPSPSQSSSSPGSPGSPSSPGSMESVDQLDQSLDDSLGEFDAEVSGRSGDNRRSEIDILRPSGSSQIESDADQPSYDDTGSIAEGDEALESRASEGPGESETLTEGSPSNSSRTPSSAEQPENVTEVPEDIGDGRGDDILLRQIRRAAQQETDPILREKLWDRYRRIQSNKR